MKVKELFENTSYERGDCDIINDNLDYRLEFRDWLKGIHITGNFDCGKCWALDSLKNAPGEVDRGVGLESSTRLTSLEGIGRDYFTRIGDILILPNSIKSNILGILKIRDLKNVEVNTHSRIPLQDAIEIINKHLKSDRNIRKCKLELEDAGLEEYAKL